MRALATHGLVSLALLGALAPGWAADPPAGSFTGTGGMQAGPRAQHDSVLLADGRVLVVGGHGTISGAALATAEVYDPSTGTWSAAGTMAQGRSGTTSNRLPDGRVLVAGGSLFGTMHASTEIWNPATLSFTPGPSMSTPRGGHVGITLADGRILVAGGATWTDTPVAAISAEIYDPSTNSWSATGSMLHRRLNHAAALLADGRVLVAGGGDGAPSGYRGGVLCEIYDPATGTFSAAASMAAPRGNFRVARLPDGRVLAVGGDRNATGAVIHAAEVYDPAADAWSPAGTTASGGTFPSLAVLADGRALAAGGTIDAGAFSEAPGSGADLFDPATLSFAPLPPMTTVRRGHSATLLSDGTVLLAGGYVSHTTYPYWTPSCELFVPAAANRDPVADAGADRTVECTGAVGGTAVTLDGGGSGDEDGDALSWSWTWSGGSATGVAPTISLPDGSHAITLVVADGKGGTSTDEVVVTIEDTTAPVVYGVSADPSVIEGNNHKMVAVTVAGTAADLCDLHPTLRILSVASNEPVNGLGDGDTDGDWEITGDMTLLLRAERSGKGSGRIYTITLAAADGAGNESTATVVVTVPKDAGKGGK